MKQIECPICHEIHDENEACPRCSFEFHQIFTPSNHFQEIEQKCYLNKRLTVLNMMKK